MKRFNRKRKGISLTEIICTLAILSLIMLTAVQLLQLGAEANTTATREFELQSGARIAMETVTNKIRYSTAVFIIPETGFKENKLDKGWNYMGVMETVNGQKELVLFEYVHNEVTGSWYHKKTVLLDAQKNFVYDLQFKKRGENNDRLIQYFFTIYQKGEEYWELDSEAEAMNSLQVVDWGTDANKGRAIAYQSTERDVKKKNARVALVVDVSISMAYSFDGTKKTGNERHNAMVESALKLLETFAQHDNIQITIIPYSTTANFPAALKDKYGTANYTFLNTQSDYQTLCSIVNSLRPVGGTNTGDGLRRAYHALLEDDAAGTLETADYVIILSDGDMTMAAMDTLKNTGARLTESDVINRDFYMASGDTPNTNNGLLYGVHLGYFSSVTGEVIESKVTSWFNDNSHYNDQALYDSLKGCIYGRIQAENAKGVPHAIDIYSGGYVKAAGKRLKDYGVTPYFVALSSDVTTNGIGMVQHSLGINDSAIYNPTNRDALLRAFESIGDEIVQDMWFINGPSW